MEGRITNRLSFHFVAGALNFNLTMTRSYIDDESVFILDLHDLVASGGTAQQPGLYFGKKLNR